MQLNHPVTKEANGWFSGLVSNPAQWYTDPDDGYVDEISARERHVQMVKKDPNIQDHMITAGPPSTRPSIKRAQTDVTTATDVKQKENAMNPSNPLIKKVRKILK